MKLFYKLIEGWKTISLIIGICGTCFAGVTWYANKQIEKYKEQQEQVLTKEQLQKFSVKIDNIYKSDSIKTIQLNDLVNAVRANTSETKATSNAVKKHFEKEKKWEELINFQQSLLDELKKNDSRIQ